MSRSERERRQSERIEVSAQVSLRKGGATTVLPVGNISAGGIYLQLSYGQMAGVGIGEVVGIYIDFGTDDYGDPLELDVEAEVVRVELGGPDRPPGIALMWTSSDPEVAQQLVVVLDYMRGRQA